MKSGVSRDSRSMVSLARCAVLLEYEVTSWDSTDLREEMLAEKNVAIIGLRPVYLCSWLDKDQFCAAQTGHDNRYHHWAREIGSSVKRRSAEICFLRVPDETNAIVLRRFIGGATVKIFSSENHMKGTVWSGYFLSSCLARVKSANLFATVSSCAFFFRKQTNFKSRLTILWTDDLEMSSSCAICRIVLWVPGASSWLNTSSSTESMFWAVRALRVFPLPVYGQQIRFEQFIQRINGPVFSETLLIVSSLQSPFPVSTF